MVAQSVAVNRVAIFRMSLSLRLLLILLAYLPLVPYALTGQIDPSRAAASVTVAAMIAATLVFLSGPRMMCSPILWLYARLTQSGFRQITWGPLAFYEAHPGRLFSPDRYQLPYLVPQILTVLLGLTGALPADTAVLIALVYGSTLSLCSGVIDTLLEVRLARSF
jgi:hypothetical protein